MIDALGSETGVLFLMATVIEAEARFNPIASRAGSTARRGRSRRIQ
jgi:hypothetical protein